ncbi:SRPBCC family protein [Methylibium sp.]|uniref:SRPBCC family protein n=1 Tax=Methylibium sp. TaxID=2067992 RepID=UPI003D0B1C1F
MNPMTMPHPAAQRFELLSHWHLDAPVAAVWQALSEPQSWPQWWPYARRVELRRAGDAQGLGAVRRFVWVSRFRYAMEIDVEIVELVPQRRLRGRVDGQLQGEGLWELQPVGDTTRVDYTWRVDVTRPWMRWLAPLLAPVFAWSHESVMRAGERGLAQRLGVRRIAPR